jgi:hypothetical protein
MQRGLASFFAPRGAALSTEALEREAAVRARAAEREEEQQRRKLRARAMLSFFFARLGVSEQQRVGRPRKGDNLRREQAHALACAYSSLPRDAAEEAENVTPEAWLLGSKCRALCREKGWLDLHEPAAAKPAADGEGAEALAVVTGVAGAAVERPLAPKTYNGANAALMACCNTWMHVWAADGTHAGWRTTVQLVAQLHEQLYHAVPPSTAARWLAAEKARYEQGKGVRKKPDLVELIKAATATATAQRSGAVAEDLLVEVEPPQTVFGSELLPALVERCNSVIDVAGFGADLVAAFAVELYHASVDEAVDVLWVPSPQWCYWFMHKHLGLVPRRITNHSTASPAQVGLQARLHALNVEHIAIARHEGLPDKYIMGSDEFGHHLFPFNKVKWEKKGAQHVSSDLPEDKRQYTGDIVHNAAGQIITALQIWTGKTTTSLPPPAVMERFKGRILFDKSHNHWANHDTKLRLLKNVWAWVCKEWEADCLPGDPRCIYLLDCWPVNLTARLREELAAACPGMDLRFIPAGATGTYQVNDTHMHKPLKDHSRGSAQRWRVAKILVFRKQRDMAIVGGMDKAAADEVFSKRVNALMKIKVLRANAPSWLWEGCVALLQPADGLGSANVILKGWQQLYFAPAAAPGFVMTAYERRRAREAEAMEAEVQRRLAEAGCGAASSEGVMAAPHAALAALVAQVASLEQALHDGEVPQVEPRRRGKGGAPRPGCVGGRAARPIAAEDDGGDVPPAAGEGGGGGNEGARGGGGGDGSGKMAGLTLKQLQERCKEKQLASYGTKSVLMNRLQAWKPGAARSKRGRRSQKDEGAAPAKKAKVSGNSTDEESAEEDAVAAAKEAGEAGEEVESESSDEEEEEEEEEAALVAEAARSLAHAR